jgi:hypothetical protein
MFIPYDRNGINYSFVACMCIVLLLAGTIELRQPSSALLSSPSTSSSFVRRISQSSSIPPNLSPSIFFASNFSKTLSSPTANILPNPSPSNRGQQPSVDTVCHTTSQIISQSSNNLASFCNNGKRYT